MKITKTYLKQLIREAIEEESKFNEGILDRVRDFGYDVIDGGKEIAAKITGAKCKYCRHAGQRLEKLESNARSKWPSAEPNKTFDDTTKEYRQYRQHLNKLYHIRSMCNLRCKGGDVEASKDLADEIFHLIDKVEAKFGFKSSKSKYYDYSRWDDDKDPRYRINRYSPSARRALDRDYDPNGPAKTYDD